MTVRRRIPTRERLDIYNRHAGKCYLCGQAAQVNDLWDVEHIIPLEMGGDEEPGSKNLAPAHRRCHRVKTSLDLMNIAKAKRRAANHLGAKAPSRSPLPGGRNSKWRKKLDGTVVPR
jgi:5-methylcytosine-specific restriction endonuclease McrA